jgi:hypothetical protein
MRDTTILIEDRSYDNIKIHLKEAVYECGDGIHMDRVRDQ